MKPAPNQRLKDDVAEVIESRASEAERAQIRLEGARLALLMVEDWAEEQIHRVVTLLDRSASWVPEPWARGIYGPTGNLTPEAKEALALLRELLNPEPKEDR